MTTEDVVRAALYHLRYPTTDHWLTVAAIAYRRGMTSEALAANLLKLNEKPINGGGMKAKAAVA